MVLGPSYMTTIFGKKSWSTGSSCSDLQHLRAAAPIFLNYWHFHVQLKYAYGILLTGSNYYLMKNLPHLQKKTATAGLCPAPVLINLRLQRMCQTSPQIITIVVTPEYVRFSMGCSGGEANVMVIPYQVSLIVLSKFIIKTCTHYKPLYKIH